MFGAWCVRGDYAGAQVSTPLGWDEIDAIHPDELTIESLPARLDPGRRPRGRAMNDDAQST